ncbi:MAG: stage III sporulation protein AB [Faecousia sp.]
MSYKWIGAALIVGSCGGFGISMAVHQKREEAMLTQLCRIIDEMLWELPFQLTPLPELIRHTAGKNKGSLGAVFLALAEQLDRQVLPDVLSCMEAGLQDSVLSFPRLRSMLLLLGQSLGRFDLSGQLKGLTSVRERCGQELQELQSDRDTRLRSYRILSLCAGAALVILLI